MSKFRVSTQHPAETIQRELLDALSSINRHGSFVCQGSITPILPGLEIYNVGEIGFPLIPEQATLIRGVSEQAPFGKGEQTIVDTNVRRVWQLSPDQFRVKNKAWPDFLSGIVKTVQQELGLEDLQLEPQLYNLLLYDKDSFFLPHRDGEKIDRMVATLVIVLPSCFAGGELIVQHEGQQICVDFGAQEDCAYKLHFTAFYADCEHEVLPLLDGYRLCLVYNLAVQKGRTVGIPNNHQYIDQVESILQKWTGQEGTIPRKLVVKLDHQYTQNGLQWDTLKGLDRTRAQVLRQAAEKAGYVAQLAKLTYWEQGYGVESYSPRGRRYASQADTKYDMEEVYDSKLTATLLLHDCKGLAAAGVLRVAETEVVSRESLKAITPEEHFEGYMGNYGDTLDRWYRHACIVLWPKEEHFSFLCELGQETSIVELQRLLHEMRTAPETQQHDLREACTKLARQIIDHWEATRTAPLANRYHESPSKEDGDDYDTDYDQDFEDEDDDEEESDGEANRSITSTQLPRNGADFKRPAPLEFLSALQILDNATLTKDFLSKVVAKDTSLDLPESFLVYCGNNHADQLLNLFEEIFRSTNAQSLLRNVRLFALFCSAEFQHRDEYVRLIENLFKELISALRAIDKNRDEWSSSSIDRPQLLSDLIKILVSAKKFDALSTLLSYISSQSKRYEPRAMASLQCQLNDWLLKNCKQDCAISSWLDRSVKFLRDATAAEPAKPTDLRRSAGISCRCVDCTELVRFLNSPTESVCHFKVRQDRRQHLHQMIDSHQCDLFHVTERRGSPQTLVCTKNTKSYERSVIQYKKDKETLAQLQILQKRLEQVWRGKD